MDTQTNDRLIALERRVAELAADLARRPVREAKVRNKILPPLPDESPCLGPSVLFVDQEEESAAWGYVSDVLGGLVELEYDETPNENACGIQLIARGVDLLCPESAATHPAGWFSVGDLFNAIGVENSIAGKVLKKPAAGGCPVWADDEEGESFDLCAALGSLAGAGAGKVLKYGEPCPSWGDESGGEPGEDGVQFAIGVASVDEATGVGSGDGTFSFDGAAWDVVPLAGAPATSGTAVNRSSAGFHDNEKFLIVCDPAGPTFYAYKLGVNVFKCLVNESGGVLATDATFSYDSPTAIHGVAPPSTGTIANVYADEYFNNQTIVCIQLSSNSDPIPLTRGATFVRVRGTITSGDVNAGTSTFTLGSLTTLAGEFVPFSTITVKNEPPIFAANGAVVEAWFSRAAHATDLDKMWDTGGWNLIYLLRAYSQYSASDKLTLTSNANTMQWNTFQDISTWGVDYVFADDQVYQKRASVKPKWEGTTDDCPPPPE